jgi:PAP2 superfamily
MLWKGFDDSALTEGISAMPSMHVGTATLFALAAWPINRTFGKILAIHAMLIQIGSVALAWHYAIDGYVAAALTFALWWISAPVARWWHRQAPQVDFAEAAGREA